MGTYLQRRKHWQWVNRANNSGGPAAPADKGRNKQYCIGSAVRRESPGVQLPTDRCLSQKGNQGRVVTSAQGKEPWFKLGHPPQHREVQGQTPLLALPRNSLQRWELKNTTATCVLAHAVHGLDTFATLSSQIHHWPLSGGQQKQYQKFQNSK